MFVCSLLFLVCFLLMLVVVVVAVVIGGAVVGRICSWLALLMASNCYLTKTALASN